LSEPGPPVDARSRRSLWLRLLLGAVVVVSASASATAVAAFREVDTVVHALRSNERLDLGPELAQADAGRPQTLMVIGSDRRARTARDAGSGARADTIILVRLDPSKGATALMSLPRDLKVRIPGHGTDKLNAAYSIGGSRLTLRTVKQLTGLRINHVINVNFGGFRESVDAVGCVYTDVDRRYFNDNSGPEKYATIDIQPGYQKMCGADALDYVRYRHLDNDLVRAARQQDFLRQAKQQVGAGRIIREREKLVRVFGRHTQSDVDSRAAVLSLLRLTLASARQPIREVHFEGEVGPSYFTASSARIRKLAREFLGTESTEGPRPGARPRAATGRAHERGRKRRPSRVRVVDAAAEGRAQRLQAIAAGADFPVFYPRVKTPGASFASEPRVYGIRTPPTERRPKGRVHNAYRMVIHSGRIGEYYGLQGTTWKDPPILRDPSEIRRIDGRRFELHYDGDRLRLVAWRTPGASYWVSNTLLQSLSERELLAIARSATR
jgi:LCP family protein required for cell wall assembly